jgi:hypothetical protein
VAQVRSANLRVGISNRQPELCTKEVHDKALLERGIRKLRQSTCDDDYLSEFSDMLDNDSNGNSSE